MEELNMEKRTTKTRISIPFTPQMYNAIAADAEMYGISLSAYCSFILGQYYATKERMMSGTENNLIETMNAMQRDLNKF